MFYSIFVELNFCMSVFYVYIRHLYPSNISKMFKLPNLRTIHINTYDIRRKEFVVAIPDFKFTVRPNLDRVH